ncbi:MAG: hypothetical protein ATN35_09885 [Epulopiscium sp. Nele67-Bin004]|nr:MAG: hypothetical protein ATN35_09885 [Epulopiscium sp. Nele67-Bin004]
MELTYIFIAHDLSVVQYMSDRIIVVYLGKIVEIATAKDLYDNALHPYTKALLSAIPVPKVNQKSNREELVGEAPSPINKLGGCSFHTRCKSAMDICKKECPPLRCSHDDHLVACHLYGH